MQLSHTEQANNLEGKGTDEIRKQNRKRRGRCQKSPDEIRKLSRKTESRNRKTEGRNQKTGRTRSENRTGERSENREDEIGKQDG